MFEGQNIRSLGSKVSKYRAKVSMVFQSFNLFNNMNVLDNCTVGQIKVLGRDKRQRRKKQ